MKATAKKILSFVIVACLAFIGVFTAPIIAANAEITGDRYVKVTEAPTDWSGDYLIVYEDESFIFDGSLSTLDAANNYKEVTIDTDAISADGNQKYQFTIASVSGGYSIQAASGKYIGHSADANKLTASDTALVNTLSFSDGNVDIVCAGGAYLRFNTTSGQDRFRYYKSTTYTSQKAICLYKFVSGDEPIVEPDPEIQAAVDNVKSYMSLSYTYTQETVDKGITFEFGENGAASHVDGSSATTYTETVSDYTLNIESGVKMSTNAYDATGNSCIKLGTSSAVGSFSITSIPEDVTNVIIHIAKYKANTTKIAVNGTDYTLTNNSNDGAYDAIKVDTSSTKTVTLTTVSGGARAMINSITYEVENADAVETEKVTVLKDSEFRIRCGVDASLKNIEGIESYGIRVSVNGNGVNYTTNATSWNEESDPFYIVISLGDIINDTTKLKTEFTVQAYVVGSDGLTYKSASEKKHSVATMVAEYYGKAEVRDDVEHLYNYLLAQGLIVVGEVA